MRFPGTAIFSHPILHFHPPVWWAGSPAVVPTDAKAVAKGFKKVFGATKAGTLDMDKVLAIK